METRGPGNVSIKKTLLTPKAIIYQKFGVQACYRVEEVHESTQNGCPGLAIPQKGPCLYRCCLQLPEFSVESNTFKRKKDAEQSAAEMALARLGINPSIDNCTVQDPWDELVSRLSYLFSNEGYCNKRYCHAPHPKTRGRECRLFIQQMSRVCVPNNRSFHIRADNIHAFLSSLNPLSGHFRAALHRKGHLYGLVPISVLAVYDAKLSKLCESINPKVESNPLLIMPLMLRAAPRLSGCVCTSEEHVSMKRENPYPPEIIQSVVNEQSILPESNWVEAMRIPFSVEKTVEPLTLIVASNGYYLDVIAQELGLIDASRVLVSRPVGKASSDMRLYFCAPKSCKGVSYSGFLHSEEPVYFEKPFNVRASYLAGHLIHGDAILASIGYKWNSTDLFYENVSLRTYYRMLIGKTPTGVYKLSREAILVAELPSAFSTKANWRGSYPRDLLFTFCRQNHLSEPELESVPVSPGLDKLKVTESAIEVSECGNGVGGATPVGSEATFVCEVKIFSKCQDLIIKCFPKKSFKKQNDAIQDAALKVLLWLNKYFRKPGLHLEELTSFGHVLDIQFDPQLFLKAFAQYLSVCTFWQSIGAQGGRQLDSNCMNQLNGIPVHTLCPINIEGPDSSVSPSNGSLACIIYTICLVTEGENMKEVVESSEEFEFEIGIGSVISSLEAVVTQMSVGQSARFYMDLPPQELIIASSHYSLTSLSLLTSSCSLECSTTLLRVTEPLEDRMEQALFSPPLSKQRVEYALQHIIESRATSLVDFGCGSGSLLDSLLEYPTSLEKIVGVDISPKGLIRAAKILHSKLSRSSNTAPSAAIKSALLFDGSITVFDSRLYGFDIGTCLEVIEHMEEEQAHLFGNIVLSCFCPKILIVSTPNYEYNVILQGSSLQSQEEDPDEKTQSQSCKFRNHDHKFEWTREQFNRWASDLAARHNYSVEFSGVGGAAGKEPGFASQIALFRRRDECPERVDVTHKYAVVWEWRGSTNNSTSAL